MTFTALHSWNNDAGARVQGKRISNSRLKPKGDVAAQAMRGGAAGLAFVRVAANGELEGAKAIREGLSQEQAAEMLALCGANEGDLLLIAAGDAGVVNRCAPVPAFAGVADWPGRGTTGSCLLYLFSML